MAAADVKLLFGVSMAGDPAGDSAKQIQEDLKKIIDDINEHHRPTIKIGLKPVGGESGGNKSWNAIIKDKLKTLSNSDKFSVKISKIDIAGKAINDFKTQLSRVISTMTLDKSVSVTLGTPTGDIAGETKKVAQETAEATAKMAAFKAELGAVVTLRGKVGRAVNAAVADESLESQRAQVDAISKAYADWCAKIKLANEAGAFGNGGRQGLIDEGNKILNSLRAITGETTRLAKEAAKVSAEADKAADNVKKWTAAKNGKSSAAYKEYSDDAAALRVLADGLKAGTIDLEAFKAQYPELHARLEKNARLIRENGDATKSWGDKLGGLAKKFASWFSVSQIIMKIVQAMKKMVKAVIEIDTAMTELKKVTDETTTTYNRFLDEAAERAKKLGATITDVVNATADFARLGYNIADAAMLADVATVYKNVGDGIENIGEASESIIATMKAFGVSAKDAMSIVDKFNEVGNNFAISSKGVGDALLRSASAMHAAGNDLDETIALATAANTIVQSPEKVGTTLKTISMFLRSAKTELEDAGESTEGMAESVSKLRKNILLLTDSRVDIQKDADTYKSTYEILKDLSEVWGDLTDVTRANILEMIGGKRNANVTAALLENFELVDQVLEKSRNAAGSAMKENEKYLDSIQGHINQFKATFQKLSQNLIDGSFVKGFVDFGKVLLEILNLIAKVIKAVGGLKTVLTAVVGIIAAMHWKRMMASIAGVPAAIKKITTALTAMAQRATAANWVVLALTVALTAFLAISHRAQEAQQHNRDMIQEAAEKAKETKASLDSLIASYKQLAESGIDTDDKREEARNIQEQITELVGKQAENLDLVNGGLSDEIKKLDEIAYKQARNTMNALQTKARDAEDQYNAGIQANGSNADFMYFDAGRGSQYGIEYGADIYRALGMLGITGKGESSGAGRGRNILDTDVMEYGGSNNYGVDLNGKDAEYVLHFYKVLQDTLLSDDSWQSAFSNVTDILNSIQSAIDFYQGIVDERNNALHDFFESKATAELYEYLQRNTIDSQESFDAFIDSVKTATDYSSEYKQVLIDMANETFPQFDREAQAAAEAAEREAEAARKAAEANERAMMMNDPMGYVISQFEGVADAISSVREAMEPLTKLQEEVADGFTMSIDKALEFAKVYPEILQGAQVAADGQITLNEEVVNSFIDGKKLEIGAELDKQIATLEAERELYVGLLELEKAKLSILRQAAEGEIKITREGVLRRMEYAQQEANAMIEAGMSAEEAYAIAADHMSDASYDFATNVYVVAQNVRDNMAAAANAVGAEGGLVGGVKRAMAAFGALTKQAHEAAKAVAGVSKGDATAGSEDLIDIGGGVYQYTDKATGGLTVLDKSSKAGSGLGISTILEGVRARNNEWFASAMDNILEEIDLTSANIASFEDAISLIDGQIATLRAAKEIGFTTTGGSTSGGSSGGSSSSSSDKELDRLKSIVSLLESELKIMEAQDAPAQDRIDKIREIQAALMDEINYLKSIGADQETINNLTLQWLNYNKEIDDIYQDTADKAKSALDELVQYRVKMLQDELKRQKENLDKQLDALKEFYDKQKQLLRDQYDEDKYLDQQAEKRKKVADIEAQLEQLRYDDSAWAQKRRAELEAELADARKELDDFEKEHALDMTEKMLDDQYEAQAKEIEKEKDLIDEQLDDEEGLYQQAFNDILAGGEDLYKALLDWNKKYGDHIDETITTAWHNAAKALQDYKDLYGEDYEGVQLTDVTGTSESGSGKPGGGTPSGGSHTTTPSDSGQDKTGGSGAAVTDEVRRQVAAAIWNGSYGWGSGADRAKKLKEVFGDNNGIQALVNKGVGRNGPAPSRDFTYLNMRKKFRGYATGTRSALPGWHAIDENGSEMIFETADGSRYKLFGGGEKVLNANASNFLYDFANGGKKVLADLLRVVVNPGIGGITDPRRQISINAGDIIIQGNADKATVSEIRRARRESMDYILKEFDRLSR